MSERDWPELGEAPKKKKSKLSVPPLKKNCSFEGCPNQATVKGMCNVHYQRMRNERMRGESGQPGEPVFEKQGPAPAREEVKKEDVKGLVVVTMTTLSLLVDESFTIMDDSGALLPHAEQAIREMTPFLEMYAGSLARLSPYIGFAMGCIALGAPTIGPLTEIVAGVRNPRIMRKTPDDVYTDAWKNSQARRAEKRAEKRGDAPASEQTVETKAA